MKRKLKIVRSVEPYYRHGDFTLYKADSLQLLSKIDDESANLIFSDPPYFINKCHWDRSRGVERDFEFQLEWIDKCKRILKPDGTIWITGTHHSIFQCGFALQKLRFKIVNDIIWYKPNAVPNLSRRSFSACHETLLWAKKSKNAKYTFNYQFLKHHRWPGDIFKNPGKQMRTVWTGNGPEDLWALTPPGPSEKRQGKHPTQKPLALLRRIILASTKRGDIILDPFSGSSTTGIAAHELGRVFIGIDQEEEYLDLSIRRFKAHFLESKTDNKPAIKAGFLTN